MQAMVNGLNGEYDALSETLYNCDGALMNTAKTMQDNLTGKVTEMQSALEGLGINFYDYLEEPLKSAVQAATKEIGDLSESVTKGQLAEVIERLAEQFGKLIEKTAKFAADKGIRGEVYRTLLPKLESADPVQRDTAARALRYALSALAGEL